MTTTQSVTGKAAWTKGTYTVTQGNSVVGVRTTRAAAYRLAASLGSCEVCLPSGRVVAKSLGISVVEV